MVFDLNVAPPYPPQEHIDEASEDAEVEYRPDVGEVLDTEQRRAEPFRGAIAAILHFLCEDFPNELSMTSVTAIHVAAESGHCLSDVLRAGEFLSERQVITMEYERLGMDPCKCLSCVGRRTYFSFPYDSSIDYDETVRAFRRSCDAAQYEAERALGNTPRGLGWVYLIRCGDRHKIGVTTDMSRRLDQLKGQSPYPLELVHQACGWGFQQFERELHHHYDKQRVYGEWFVLEPGQTSQIIHAMDRWSARGRGQR